MELLNIIAAQPPWCQQACDRKDQLCPRWFGGYNRPKRPCRWSKVQAAFRARYPKTHRDFLKTLKVSATIGDYFFCHAGVRPGVGLDRQNRDDLLSIREPFLSSETEHGKAIAHGYTPSVAPEVRANRIGIDTAAPIRLVDEPVSFWQRPAPFLGRNAATITARCRGQSTEAQKTFNSGRARDFWDELNVEPFRHSAQDKSIHARSDGFWSLKLQTNS